jgi:Putative transposase
LFSDHALEINRRNRVGQDRNTSRSVREIVSPELNTAVWVPEDDRAFATRLARYCGRNPVALERLTYDRAERTVTYRSDKSEGPTAGTETADPLEFLARVLVHIPDKDHVATRYYGGYANRLRGMRGHAAPAGADAPVPMVITPKLAPTQAPRRWAALLRQIFEVDPLVCPRCAGAMRIVACVTQAAVIDQILAHLCTRATAEAQRGARSPPATGASVARSMRRRPTASAAPRHAPCGS